MRGLAAVLLLAGCAALPPGGEPENDGPTRLQLSPEGLAVAGSAQVISFSRSEPGVVAAVTRLLGNAPDTRSGTAACHTIGWGGLKLHFQGDDFLGWSDTDGRVALLGGLAVGSSGAVPAGIRSATDAQGRIASLSAGALCQG